jgi:hypothetical protein
MTDWYAEIAAELHRMADDVSTLAGDDLSKPWFNLSIQPHGDTDDEIVTGVDTVAGALLGKPGKTYELSGGGGYHHGASGDRGPINIGVYNAVSDPAARERDAEVERLRAELVELRAVAARRAAGLPVIVVRDEMAEILDGSREVAR